MVQKCCASAYRGVLPVVLSALLALQGCRFLSGEDSIESALLPPEGGARVESDVGGEAVTIDSVQARDPQAKLGAQNHQRILERNGGPYSDRQLEELVALITADLVSQTNEKNRAYSVTLLDSPTVNAFALPGGYLYVTRGLLALANDASEVAAVLAHEMAHVLANHGINRSRVSREQDLAAQVATNVVSNPAIGQLARRSTEQRMQTFSQNQELQADALGIKISGRAGFDPYGAARFLRSMAMFTEWRSAVNRVSEDMSTTHPSTPRRIEIAERHARAFGAPGVGEKRRKRFLQGIDGMIFGENASGGTVRGNRFAHTEQGFTFQVPEGFSLSNSETAVLASGPRETALRFDSVARKGLQGSATDYIASGWVNGLDEGSIKRVKVNGMTGASARAQAGDWQFSIHVMPRGDYYYRFILAAPRTNADIGSTGESIVSTFRGLRKTEAANFAPLRLRIVTVGANDDVARLSKRMFGVQRPEQLFRALNGLGPNGTVKTGDRVKMVTRG